MNDTPDTARLDTCLDGEAMRAPLAALLARPGTDTRPEVLAVQVSQVRRSTSRHRQPHPLTLCYSVRLRRGAQGAEEQRHFYAQVFRGGASAAAAEAAAGRTLHLAALDMLLWPWPADPRLPQLPALLDPFQTLRWRGLPAQAVQALRYQPERRATLRYTLAGDGLQPLFAKTFDDDRGEAIHRRFQHFWQAAEADERAPLVARPLGYDAALRALWQEQAPGVPLSGLLAAEAPAWLPQRVAAAWAAVHHAPAALAGPGVRDRAHWLAEVQRRRKKIGRAQPALAGAAQRLADTLAEASARLPEPAPSLIHGDCHPDQLWVHGPRVVLFDFDEFKLGDPMEDLAEFITKLDGEGVQAAFGQALLSAHALAAPDHFDRARLQWHLAVQQLLQAARAFVFQRPGWPQEMAERLARAQDLAGRCLERVGSEENAVPPQVFLSPAGGGLGAARPRGRS